MDEEITILELKQLINSKIKNSMLSEYFINEIKYTILKNKTIFKKNILININKILLKDIVIKIYSNYIKELHYVKYQLLSKTFESDINTLYNSIDSILLDL